MNILFVVQGPYGERIVNNIKTRGPRDWRIASIFVPMNLPLLIDDPEDFLPQDLPKSDLVVFLSESAAASQLIPDVARMADAAGVVAPVDHASWLPLGLQGQVKQALDKMGIGCAFPKNFCTLTRTTYGYRDSAVPYESEVVSTFATYFGRPKLKVHVDPRAKTIRAIEVKRCSPCGSTVHTVEKIIGLSVDEAIPKAGLICMQYPCLASMQMERIDKGLYNTLMHLSGQIFNDELGPHLEPFYADADDA